MKIRSFATIAMALVQFSSLLAYTLPAHAKGVDPEEKVEYYLYDHLGGVDAILDEQGNTVERRDYLPFGEERAVEGGGDERHGFTGKELDGESGLYYYGARYYDPMIGRFTSVDPLTLGEAGKPFGSILDDPQEINSYSYGLNNPIKYNDPTGKFALLALALPSATQLIDAAMVSIMTYFVVRDIQAPTIEIFPSPQTQGKKIDPFPALPQKKPNIISYPDLGIQKPNVVTIPTLPNDDLNIFTFPGYNDTVNGVCGVSMSCASTLPTPISNPDDFNRLKGGQGWRDQNGDIWRKDKLHKDHWDVSNRRGEKIREIDFSGNKLWPEGAKNKNKKPSK